MPVTGTQTYSQRIYDALNGAYGPQGQLSRGAFSLSYPDFQKRLSDTAYANQIHSALTGAYGPQGQLSPGAFTTDFNSFFHNVNGKINVTNTPPVTPPTPPQSNVAPKSVSDLMAGIPKSYGDQPVTTKASKDFIQTPQPRQAVSTTGIANKKIQPAYTETKQVGGAVIQTTPTLPERQQHEVAQSDMDLQKILSQSDPSVKGVIYKGKLKDFKDDLERSYQQTQSSGAVNEDARKLKDAVLNRATAAAPDVLFNPSNDEINKYKSDMVANPQMARDVLHEYALAHPEATNKIKKALYLQDSRDRVDNAGKIVKNANDIENGDADYSIKDIGGPVYKNENWIESIMSGFHDTQKEKADYSLFSNGTPENNIKELNRRMHEVTPDDPVSRPGAIGHFIGAEGPTLTKQMVVGGVVGAIPVAGEIAAPWAAAAAGSPDMYKRAWANSYQNNYYTLVKGGMDEKKAEIEARSRAKFDAVTSVAQNAVMAGIGVKMGNTGIRGAAAAEGLGGAAKQFGRAMAHSIPETSLVAGTAGASEIAMNLRAGRPWDENVGNAMIQSGIMMGSIAVGTAGIKAAGAGAFHLAKRVIKFAPEEKLHAAIGEAVTAGRISPEDADKMSATVTSIKAEDEKNLAKAKEIVLNSKSTAAVMGHFKEVAKNDPEGFHQLLKEVADQANDPATLEPTIEMYGDDLVSIAKELFPKGTGKFQTGQSVEGGTIHGVDDGTATVIGGEGHQLHETPTHNLTLTNDKPTVRVSQAGVRNIRLKDEVRPISDRIIPDDSFDTWDLGDHHGKSESADMKAEIGRLANAWDEKAGGSGETFGEFVGRVIPAFKKELETGEPNTVISTHSATLKAMKVWDEMGRPDIEKLTPEQKSVFADKYINEKMQTGAIETFKGNNGDIHVNRHGETEDNAKGVMRTSSTRLTEKGKKEAADAAAQISEKTGGSVPKIVSSSMPRAIENANILHENLPEHKIQDNAIPIGETEKADVGAAPGHSSEVGGGIPESGQTTLVQEGGETGSTTSQKEGTGKPKSDAGDAVVKNQSLNAETTGITVKQMNETAREFGLSEYNPDPETFAQWKKQAEEKFASDPNAMAAVINKLRNGQPLEPHEVAMSRMYAADLKAKLRANPGNDDLLTQLKRFKDLINIAKRRAGKELVSYKGEEPVIESLEDMQVAMMQAMGTNKLTPEQKGQVKAQYDKVAQANNEVKNNLNKIDEANNGTRPNTAETPKAGGTKNISAAAKDLANKIRSSAKLHRPGSFSAATPGSLAWDGAVEVVAKSVEAGGKIAQAIADGIKYIKNTDWYRSLSDDKKTQAENDFNDFHNKVAEQTNAERLKNLKVKIQKDIDSLNKQILEKERIANRGKPVNTDLEYNRMVENRKSLQNLLDKYLPEQDPYEEERGIKRTERRLTNEISSLNDQINAGEREVKPSGKKYDSPYIRELMEIREAKKAQLDEVSPRPERQSSGGPKPEKTNEERLDDAKDRIKKNIETIRQQIADKERIAKEQKKPLHTDLEYGRLKEDEKALQGLLDKYLPEEKDPNADEKADRVKQKRLLNEISSLNDQINSGVRKSKSGSDAPDSDYVKQLKEIREAKKAQLDLVAPKAPSMDELATRHLNKTDNNFTPEDGRDIWNYAKETYLKNGVDDYEDAVYKTSKDLGLTAEQVRHAITTSPEAKAVEPDLYRSVHDARKVKKAAEIWLDKQGGKGGNIINTVANAAFAEKVFGHGTVSMITHAGMNMFRPSDWDIYWKHFIKQFGMAFGKDSVYEKAISDIIHHPRFNFWKQAGLAVDPRMVYNEYEGVNNFLAKLGGGGKFVQRLMDTGRGFDVLKAYRLAQSERDWARLSESEKTPEAAIAIARKNNHASGTVDLNVHPAFRTLFFAPHLELSRWSRLVGDPAESANTIIKGWKNASVEDRVFAKITARRAAETAITFAAALGANAGLLSATGSDQKINISDPSKSDWLRFKAGGHEIDPSGGIISSMRLVGNLAVTAHNGWADSNGKQRFTPEEQDIKNIGRQFENKLSPFAGYVWSGLTGAAGGRPLPGSSVKSKIEPYTVGEYVTQELTPIPVGVFFKEYTQGMKDSGATKNEYLNFTKALVTAAVVGGTGAHVVTEPPASAPSGRSRTRSRGGR